MNKRRRSGSGSAATISDESDECATPDRDVTPDMESNEDGLPLMQLRQQQLQQMHEQQTNAGNFVAATTPTTTATSVLLSSGRKKKKLDPVSVG